MNANDVGAFVAALAYDANSSIEVQQSALGEMVSSLCLRALVIGARERLPSSSARAEGVLFAHSTVAATTLQRGR